MPQLPFSSCQPKKEVVGRRFFLFSLKKTQSNPRGGETPSIAPSTSTSAFHKKAEHSRRYTIYVEWRMFPWKNIRTVSHSRCL